jgi:hypothetical protein
MIPSRKFSFQLIPLLDLLLIVVFAQYLEGRIAGERQAEVVTASRDLVAAQLDEALRQLLALREKLSALEESARMAETQSVELDRMRVQRDLIGELVGEAFRIPAATIDQLLQQRTSAGPGPSKDDIAQLKSRLQTLSGSSGERVVEHLLTFGEMRKRVDVWELYLQENGGYVLTVGSRRMPFRAESAESFAVRLFEAYKTLPESKSMVLILVSYGDTKFGPLKATLDGLPPAIERIRIDAGQRTRFEYAVLGYRPTPPMGPE